jgi:hypothetical protein
MFPGAKVTQGRHSEEYVVHYAKVRLTIDYCDAYHYPYLVDDERECTRGETLETALRMLVIKRFWRGMVSVCPEDDDSVEELLDHLTS